MFNVCIVITSEYENVLEGLKEALCLSRNVQVLTITQLAEK